MASGPFYRVVHDITLLRVSDPKKKGREGEREKREREKVRQSNQVGSLIINLRSNIPSILPLSAPLKRVTGSVRCRGGDFTRV